MTQTDALRKVLISAAALLTMLPATAHHSSAMYDHEKSLTLKGAVREFQWTNPHCWIQLLVAENGETNEWSVQMASPSNLYRDGWKPGTLKAGDSVTLVVHPMRDGTRGGLWVSGIGPDSKPIGSSTPAR